MQLYLRDFIVWGALFVDRGRYSVLVGGRTCASSSRKSKRPVKNLATYLQGTKLEVWPSRTPRQLLNYCVSVNALKNAYHAILAPLDFKAYGAYNTQGTHIQITSLVRLYYHYL